MSPNGFRSLFLENALNFLWRQWSALGLLGEARTEDPWTIDPEAMLLFTLEMGRYEPRLFDEVMDWLAVNGKWLDLQRLRGILQGKGDATRNLLGAAATFLVRERRERRWQNLVCKSGVKEGATSTESLFYQKDGRPYPLSDKPDPAFLSCGFNRPKLTVRRLTREVPITSHSTIRFLLRALFGLGSRAECLVYLLTHEGGHPAEIAKAIGLSVRGTQDALIDLARSGLVLTRVKGKRKIEYWLSQERWWEFLSRGRMGEIRRPVWIDWIALCNGLSQIWATLEEMSQEGISDYMRSSRLRDSLEAVGSEFLESGLDLPPLPGKDVRPEEYEKAFEAFIIHMLGAS